QFLKTGELLPPLSVPEKTALAKRHLSYSLDWKGGITGVFEMRQHFSNYFKSLPDFKTTRVRLITENNPENILAILDEIAERWKDY
ncbi:MAG: tRNA dihydrouridine synthase DusB, partial [Salinivirgaceae bacterium]|nr:tRNA dihydrouridine synthase DusB [Salinivirgaceae bacterium]